MITEQQQLIPQQNPVPSIHELFSSTVENIDRLSAIIENIVKLPISSSEEVCHYLQVIDTYSIEDEKFIIQNFEGKVKKADFYIDNNVEDSYI